MVITTDGEPLVQPSLVDLANAVGLSTTPAGEFYDLVIVGGGPAGLGAAVYAASEGLRTVIVERAAAGGQAGQSSRIENYLGFPDGVAGDQLTERARRQALRFGAELITARTVTGLTAKGPAREVTFDDGSAVRSHAVVLATGVSYRQLEASGADDLVGRGVYYGSASTQATACAGDHVIIVGGANSAGQAAVFFSRHAARVTMAVRGDSLERSMSSYLIEQIAGDRQHRRPAEHLGAEVRRQRPPAVRHPGRPRRRPAGGRRGAPVRLHRGRPADRLAARRLWSATGAASWSPGRSWSRAASDPRPGTWTATRTCWSPRIPGVFVAGDVRAQSVKRVASAVGEGALAVTLVHRYLAEQRSLIMSERYAAADRRTSCASCSCSSRWTPSSWTG